MWVELSLSEWNGCLPGPPMCVWVCCIFVQVPCFKSNV